MFCCGCDEAVNQLTPRMQKKEKMKEIGKRKKEEKEKLEKKEIEKVCKSNKIRTKKYRILKCLSTECEKFCSDS
jgi:hypothetical protein